MKKLLAVLIIAVMSVALFAGCSDPIYDDLSNFLNVEMVEVNEDYEKIKAEMSTWETLEDDAAIAESIDGVLLPLVNSSLEKLEKINTETEGVKAVKEKYTKVMEAYKGAFESLYEACETHDEEKINEGNAGIEKALELLDEYNKALEALAKDHGGEIEY